MAGGSARVRPRRLPGTSPTRAACPSRRSGEIRRAGSFGSATALGDVRLRERARVRAAAVTDRPLERAALVLPGPAVGPSTTVDDDRHVRVVLVVLDHLVVE